MAANFDAEMGWVLPDFSARVAYRGRYRLGLSRVESRWSSLLLSHARNCAP